MSSLMSSVTAALCAAECATLSLRKSTSSAFSPRDLRHCSAWLSVRIAAPRHSSRQPVSGSTPATCCHTVIAAAATASSAVRVRFAPSPTGNLHVGGARTALFNWLFARSHPEGKFILRIEDTDLERSTRASEEAVLRDLTWLGLHWDEGPDLGGEYGPYRQSERNSIYKQFVQQLLEQDKVYRCFCTDEELEAMRAEQEAKKLPPKYSGKWSSASPGEVEEELRKGTPHTYRFRVPRDKMVTIRDMVRGEVSWNTDTLGDFIVLRSNGQPVYNFCVAVDDATMKISHVIRAEEHLPNTLRQALIYEALKFRLPQFGHVSLILAPDRSKLSKRHGATSVGQFQEMGFLSQAMVNYLSLLGWNDGTEDEIFELQEIIQRFSIERITKSAAIFDTAKLRWMNGQHLRAIPDSSLEDMLGKEWVQCGSMTSTNCMLVKMAVPLVKNGLEVVKDVDSALRHLLSFPLTDTLVSADCSPFLEDDLQSTAASVLGAYDSGALLAAVEEGHDSFQKWVKDLGKAAKRKGKRLFMPLRICLTGSMQGPDVGSTLELVLHAERSGDLADTSLLTPLGNRMEVLRAVNWESVKLKAAASLLEQQRAKEEQKAVQQEAAASIPASV